MAGGELRPFRDGQYHLSSLGRWTWLLTLCLHSPWCEYEISRDAMGPDKSGCFLGKVDISYTLIPNSSYFPHSIIRIIETQFLI